jgi:hypothetical protein
MVEALLHWFSVATRHVAPGWAAALSFLAACSTPAPTDIAPLPWYPAHNAAGAPVLAAFESRFPCLDDEARAIPDCQRVKFALVIYQGEQAGAPASYLMSRIYVGNSDSDDRRVTSGGVIPSVGAPFDPRARIYTLDGNSPPEFRSFWAISNDVLFLLTDDGRPRVGDAEAGYALNRTVSRRASPQCRQSRSTCRRSLRRQ